MGWGGRKTRKKEKEAKEREKKKKNHTNSFSLKTINIIHEGTKDNRLKKAGSSNSRNVVCGRKSKSALAGAGQ